MPWVKSVAMQITCSALVSHWYTSAPPHCTTGPLFPSQCPCETILLNPYSMVWDWRVSRAGPMPFDWPKPPYPFRLLLFFPFSSVYRLALCDWGLWTERVHITLRSLSLPTFFNNNNKMPPIESAGYVYFLSHQREKSGNTNQYDCKKWGTHVWVFSQRLKNGNSKNEISE